MPEPDAIAQRQVAAAAAKLASLEIAWGKRHMRLLPVLQQLADLHFALGQYEHSEELYWRILSMVCKRPGDDPDGLIALSLRNIAEALHAQERYDEAERLYLLSFQATDTAAHQESDLTGVLCRMTSLYRTTDAQVKARWMENRLTRSMAVNS